MEHGDRVVALFRKPIALPHFMVEQLLSDESRVRSRQLIMAGEKSEMENAWVVVLNRLEVLSEIL